MPRPFTRSLARLQNKVNEDKSPLQNKVNEDGSPLPLCGWGHVYTIAQCKQNIENLQNPKYKYNKKKEGLNPLVWNDGCCDHYMTKEEALKYWSALLFEKENRKADRNDIMRGIWCGTCAKDMGYE
jgi:hypothetical protein